MAVHERERGQAQRGRMRAGTDLERGQVRLARLRHAVVALVGLSAEEMQQVEQRRLGQARLEPLPRRQRGVEASHGELHVAHAQGRFRSDRLVFRRFAEAGDGALGGAMTLAFHPRELLARAGETGRGDRSRHDLRGCAELLFGDAAGELHARVGIEIRGKMAQVFGQGGGIDAAFEQRERRELPRAVELVVRCMRAHERAGPLDQPRGGGRVPPRSDCRELEGEARQQPALGFAGDGRRHAARRGQRRGIDPSKLLADNVQIDGH